MTSVRQPPAFFDAIRSEATLRWGTLEADPTLAAPWWQLFRQVKSPYHVLSEVLQNADDANAAWARAWIEDGSFHFEHNGDDFEEAHFRSLCRFGLSNKRQLHTIGFRGLGFKSLFSYGPCVEVLTPTLSFAFEESRFTEPVWIDQAPPIEHTRIRVRFADERIAGRVAEDLQRWATDPVPLLFFRSIRRLELGGQTVSRTKGERGPAPHSKWVELRGASTERVLIVRSPEMAVPAEALDEIREERGDPTFELPAVSVDIVVNLPAPDRIYVVLPTTVELPLPFSCNAPFIQDPARSGIKDPANSPLNRWLLERIGTLAVDALAAWVGNTALPLDERADAYGHLLPDSHPTGSGAGAIAARQITARLGEALRGAPVVLSSDGTLVSGVSALDLPSDLAEVWTPRDALRFLGEGKTSIVASEVTDLHRRRLAFWAGLARTSQQDVITRLHTAPIVPRPALDRLSPLWAFLEPALRNDRWHSWIRELQIVPVRGEPRLRRADEVTTFSEDGDKLGVEDWEFLQSLVRALDPAWVSQLLPVSKEPWKYDATLRAAAQVLNYLKLDTVTSLVQIVATAFAAQGEIPEVDIGVRLAHIAANADIQVDATFRYMTARGQWRTAEDGLIRRGGSFEDLLPASWAEAHTLHPVYEEGLGTEQLKVWRAWLASPKSRVRVFPVPDVSVDRYWGRDQARRVCTGRGVTEELEFRLGTPHIVCDDRDFPPTFWRHWNELAVEDALVWTRLVDAIGSAWDSSMSSTAVAALHQDGRTYRYKVRGSDMPASWLHRLRGLPCVPNEHGTPCLPSTLLRHTADTAFLHGAEDFVHADVDRARMHPLLDHLGVRTHAFSADRLLDRLRALASAPTVLTHAVHPIYTALDQLAARLPADSVRSLRDVFASEPLALGNDLAWHRAESVYQRNDEGLPGAPTLWEPTAGLSLWQRLGVPARPSRENLLAWLTTLPVGERLEESQRRRIRELIGALPRQVWETCKAWLDLSGRWVAAHSLRWRVSRAVTAEGLFTKLRHATADLSMVADETLHESVFASLEPLERALSRRPIPKALQHQSRPEWLDLLAQGFVCLTSVRALDADAADPRAAGDRMTTLRLARTSWCCAEQIAVTPFIDGEQAGTASDVRAAWFEDTLYVWGTPTQHHRELVEELRRAFSNAAMRDAIADCVGRDADWVCDYLRSQLDIDLTTAPPEVQVEQAGEVEDNEDAPDAAVAGSSPTEVLLAGPQSLEHASLDSPKLSPGSRSRRTSAKPSPAGSSSAQSSVSTAHVSAHARSAPRWQIAVIAILEASGFAKDGEELWRHADGRRASIGTDPFHAVITDAGGEILASYWVGDGTLKGGILVPAATWSLISQSTTSWLVLPDDERALHGLPVSKLVGQVEVSAASVSVRLRDD